MEQWVHNANDLNDSNKKLIRAMQDADRELVKMICCYEKVGGYELTIEGLEKKRETVGMIMSHAQNHCMEWENSSKKYREVVDFSI